MSIFHITKQGIIEVSGADAERALIYGAKDTVGYVVDNSGKVSVLIVDKYIKYNDALKMVDALKAADGNAVAKSSAAFLAGELVAIAATVAKKNPLSSLIIGFLAGEATESAIDLLNRHLGLFEGSSAPDTLLPPSPDFFRDLLRGYSELGSSCIPFQSTGAAIQADKEINKLFNSGLISKSYYDVYSDWSSELLLGGFGSSFDFKFGLDASGLRYNPIGAFYESTTAAVDNSASIAQKTLVLLDSNQNGLTAAALAARDTNKDGKLSGTELAGVNAWADLNENGVLDAGELQTLTQAGLAQVRRLPVFSSSWL